MSLSDIYSDVFSSMQERKYKLIALLEKHIDLDNFIPASFSYRFYKNCGRNHFYHLKSLLWFLILKKLFGLLHYSQIITILNCSKELRLFCGFNKVPDLSQITRFCLNYCDDISVMFDRLVDIIAPICKEINSKKSKDAAEKSSSVMFFPVPFKPMLLLFSFNHGQYKIFYTTIIVKPLYNKYNCLSIILTSFLV